MSMYRVSHHDVTHLLFKTCLIINGPPSFFVSLSVSVSVCTSLFLDNQIDRCMCVC